MYYNFLMCQVKLNNFSARVVFENSKKDLHPISSKCIRGREYEENSGYSKIDI